MILYNRLLELYLGYTLLYPITFKQQPKKEIRVECYVIKLMGVSFLILPIVRDFSKKKKKIACILLFGSHIMRKLVFIQTVKEKCHFLRQLQEHFSVRSH